MKPKRCDNALFRAHEVGVGEDGCKQFRAPGDGVAGDGKNWSVGREGVLDGVEEHGVVEVDHAHVDLTVLQHLQHLHALLGDEGHGPVFLLALHVVEEA